MTGKKMMEVLLFLAESGVNPRGIHIDCTGGGELRFQLTTQLTQPQHDRMLKKGFVPNPGGTYVYRP